LRIRFRLGGYHRDIVVMTRARGTRRRVLVGTMLLAFRHLDLHRDCLHLQASRDNHDDGFFARRKMCLSGRDWCVEYHDARTQLVEKLDVERHGAYAGHGHHRMAAVECVVKIPNSPRSERKNYFKIFNRMLLQLVLK
jgi:hypothetical protein